MKIKRKIQKPESQDDGSYKICVIGSIGEEAHGETVTYANDGPEGALSKDNVKAVVTRLMDEKPLVSAAVAEVKDGEGNVVTPAQPEVKGKSASEKMLDWFKGRKEARKKAAAAVELPKRQKTRGGQPVLDANKKPIMEDDADLSDLTDGE